MKGLKIILWIAAICCLGGFVSAALPWPTISGLFRWFGIEPPAAEPVTAFVFRLASAMFGLIGVFFLILARNPLKYGAMLLLAAYGLVCYGVFCLLGGIRYSLPVYTYAGDVVFGVAAGVLLLVFRNRATQTNST